MRRNRITGGMLVLALVAAGLVAAQPNLVRPGGYIVESHVTGMAEAVAAHSDNSFVAVGPTLDIVAVGGGDVELGPVNAWIGRYTSGGANDWIREIDFGAHDTLSDVVLDGDGNIYAVGYTITSAKDAWARAFKYTPTGTQVWSLNFTFPGAKGTVLLGAVRDGDGLVAAGVAGFTEPSRSYPALVRISDAGVVTDSTYFTGVDEQFWLDIAPADTAGSWYLAGSTTQPPARGCAAKASLAAVAWNHCDGAQAEGLSRVANAGGRSVTVGHDEGSTSTAAKTLSRGADGALGWSRAYPPDLAAGTYHGTAACGEADGDSYTTSVDSAVIRLPPLEHTHTWLLEDPLLISIWNVKYDAAGTLLWEVEWGDPYNDIAVACALDSAGRLLVAGAVYDATGATIHPLVLRYEGL